MKIRHICDGQEYRYDVDSGIVTNNYGTDKSILRICAFTGTALLYKISPHYPRLFTSDLLASLKPSENLFAGLQFTDNDNEKLAQFAIGYTAALLSEKGE